MFAHEDFECFDFGVAGGGEDFGGGGGGGGMGLSTGDSAFLQVARALNRLGAGFNPSTASSPCNFSLTAISIALMLGSEEVVVAGALGQREGLNS